MKQLLLKNEFVLVVILFLFGAYLRLYHLDYPLGLHSNEAQAGLDALRLLAGDNVPFWSSELEEPILIIYWIAALFHFLPADVATLRLSFVLFWIISIPFFYGIVRILFDKEIALISLFLFVVDRTLLHFSHIAYSPYIPPFLISIFFFLYAIKTSKKWAFAVSGFLVGFSFYFYIGLFMLPLVCLFYLIYLYHKRTLLDKFRMHILLFITFFFVAIMPILVLWFQHPTTPLARTRSISLFSERGKVQLKQGMNHDAFWEILPTQIGNTLLMFHVRGDDGDEQNIPYLPLLDRVSGIFFLIGVVYSLMNIRKKSFVFLAIWFSIFLIGTIFSAGAPNFRRIQPSIAATSVIVAIGMVVAYRSFVTKFPRLRVLYQVLFLLSFLSIYLSNAHFYNTTQAISDKTKKVFGYHIVKTAQFLSFIKKQYPNVYIYFYGKDFTLTHETMRFLAPGLTGESGSNNIQRKFPQQPTLYVFFPESLSYDAFKTVHSRYPHGKDYVVNYTNSTVLLYAYLVTD